MTERDPESRSGEHRGWVAPQPGTGMRPGAPPKNRRVSGAADRTSPLARGPSALGSHRQHALTHAARATISRRARPAPPQATRSPEARARGRPASPSQHPDSPVLSCPHRQACASCPVPLVLGRIGAPLGSGPKVFNV